jgi:hypothetical protein
MKLPKLLVALGVVAFALAVAFLSFGAGGTAEAKDTTGTFARPLITEKVDVWFQVQEEDGFTTTVVVRASQQRGTSEVDVRYSVSRCPPKPSLPELSACWVQIHQVGWLTGTLDFSLKEAKLTVRPNPPDPPCDTFTCPISRSRDVIALKLRGIGRVTREGNTLSRDAVVTGIVEGVTVPPGVLGTLSVNWTRPPNN